MKILIAGLGSIGRRHLRNLVTLGERDVLLYRTRRSTLPDDELSGFPVETDLKTALDWGPQAVIVANPTALHLEVAVPAAQAGCHLLLEKPVSHSMEGIEALQSAVQSGDGQVLVGFQFRFHPGLRKVSELLAEGAIGKPVSARVVYAEYLPVIHPWEDYRRAYSARADLGGGVILTFCHPLDYLPWLLGPVQALWSFTGRLGGLELDVEDTAEIGLRFSTGALAVVSLGYNQQPPAHTLEIVGTNGSLRWDNADGAVHLYKSVPQARRLHYPAPAGFERNELFLAELRHFLRLARGEEKQPLCTLEEGLQALDLALAARRSGADGEQITWVR